MRGGQRGRGGGGEGAGGGGGRGGGEGGEGGGGGVVMIMITNIFFVLLMASLRQVYLGLAGEKFRQKARA